MAGNQNWATPQDFWRVLDDEFGFDIDVAASDGNAKTARYITAKHNALDPEIPWFPFPAVSAYCNPPFRVMSPWVRKAHAEANSVPNGTVVVVGPASQAEWAQWAYIHAAEVRLLVPRVQFVAPDGVATSSNRTDCAAYVFRRTAAPRANVFFWDWRAALARLGE